MVVRTHQEATDVLQTATISQRDLTMYTWIAAVPVAVTVALFLWQPRLSPKQGSWLVILAAAGAIIYGYGLGKLIYELVLDIAGFPSFKLPVWAVLYLILYCVLGFTYVYFGLYWTSPGRYIKGFGTDEGTAFVDSMYMSLCGFMVNNPYNHIHMSRETQFMTITQGLVAMFINLFIITKFVTAFGA
jgi:hypothetical protein